MKFKIAVLGATGYIGVPYRREIRECPDDATIVSFCGRRLELLEAAARSAQKRIWLSDLEGELSSPQSISTGSIR